MAKIIERKQESDRLTLDRPVEEWEIKEGDLWDLSHLKGLDTKEIDGIREGVRVRVDSVLVTAFEMGDGRLVRIFPYETFSPMYKVRGLPSFSPAGMGKDLPTVYPNAESMGKCLDRREERETVLALFPRRGED